MESRDFIKMVVFAFLLVILSGCPAPIRVSTEPPVPLDPFMSSQWGDSVGEVKAAIARDGGQWFKDNTEQSPCSLYATGNYMDFPATFSYFFTPRSKKLYRVDVTFNDLKVYEKAKSALTQKLKAPSYSQADVDYWAWDDKSLVILQKNATHVQISYSKGPLLELNQKEGGLETK
jgi:hypothetical protein